MGTVLVREKDVTHLSVEEEATNTFEGQDTLGRDIAFILAVCLHLAQGYSTLLLGPYCKTLKMSLLNDLWPPM